MLKEPIKTSTKIERETAWPILISVSPQNIAEITIIQFNYYGMSTQKTKETEINYCSVCTLYGQFIYIIYWQILKVELK